MLDFPSTGLVAGVTTVTGPSGQEWMWDGMKWTAVGRGEGGNGDGGDIGNVGNLHIGDNVVNAINETLDMTVGLQLALGDPLSTFQSSRWTLGNPGMIGPQNLVYANGTFVGQQTGNVFISQDGLNWTTYPAATNGLTTTGWGQLAYGTGGFMLGANSGNLYQLARSIDGISWTQSTGNLAGIATRLVFGNGVFLFSSLGNTWGANALKSVARSTDGVNFTLLTINDDWPILSTQVYFAGDRFFASQQTRAATSTDGLTWTTIDIGLPAGIYTVAYGNGYYLALSQNWAARSTDGINWTTSTILGVTPQSFSLAFGNGVFVAAFTVAGVDYGRRLMTSTDGFNWKITPVRGLIGPWGSIAFGDGKFVMAAGSTGFQSLTATAPEWDFLNQ